MAAVIKTGEQLLAFRHGAQGFEVGLDPGLESIGAIDGDRRAQRIAGGVGGAEVDMLDGGIRVDPHEIGVFGEDLVIVVGSHTVGDAIVTGPGNQRVVAGVAGQEIVPEAAGD